MFCNYSKIPQNLHPLKAIPLSGSAYVTTSGPKAQHLQRGQPGAINMESGAALVGKPQETKNGVSGHRTRRLAFRLLYMYILSYFAH